MKSIHTFQKKELIQLIAIAAIFLAVLFVISIIRNQQDLRNRASETARCGNANNLLSNCDFETAIDFNRRSGDWQDIQNDSERDAGPNQYSHNNTQVSDTKGLALQIGNSGGTCDLPRAFPADKPAPERFRIYSGTIQTVNVEQANTFHLSFDVQVKSGHTYWDANSDNRAAPFWVWSGFQEYKTAGKEIFLTSALNNERGENFCNEPAQSRYVCEQHPALRETSGNQKSDCDNINSEWKRVDVNFTRDELCQGAGQDCIGNAKKLFVSFGVTNNFDTIAKVDNVVLTADGIVPQTGVSSTPIPTSPPVQAEVSFYFTKENSTTPLTSLTKKVGETEAFNLYLDTKGKNIAGFEADVVVPDDWTVNPIMGDGEGANRFANVAARQVGQTIRFSKYNLTANVQGNLLLATIRLTAKKQGSGQIKFKYTEAFTQSGLLTQEYQNINYSITNAQGGTSGSGTSDGATPGAGTPASSGRVLVCPTAEPGKQIQITNCVVVTVTP